MNCDVKEVHYGLVVGGIISRRPSPSTLWAARIQPCTNSSTWVKGCCKGLASTEQSKISNQPHTQQTTLKKNQVVQFVTAHGWSFRAKKNLPLHFPFFQNFPFFQKNRGKSRLHSNYDRPRLSLMFCIHPKLISTSSIGCHGSGSKVARGVSRSTCHNDMCRTALRWACLSTYKASLVMVLLWI